ncbi:hypothetical protein V6N11_069754 [Hibiscus sabdariffa]|uniref:RNase H type-1 domain-containing protein n=1 Tax=Hibiscus sabdariffa TaxID=183260 RepID=A0ABR2Q3Q9_9ROSI
MVDEFGMWDWSRILTFIHVPVARKIAAIKPPSPSFGPDVPGWRWESNRVFSMSLAYERLATTLWVAVIKPIRLHNFLSLPFVVWLQSNLQGSCSFVDNKECWGEQFAVYLWMLWKDRCNRIFNDSYVPQFDFRKVSENLTFEYVKVNTKVPNHAPKLRAMGGWDRPPEGWIKINTDGAVCGDQHIWVKFFVATMGVQHVYRERNLVADRLASLSRNLPLGVTKWEQVPDQVASLISREAEVC